LGLISWFSYWISPGDWSSRRADFTSIKPIGIIHSISLPCAYYLFRFHLLRIGGVGFLRVECLYLWVAYRVTWLA
jgi:hypothetical protein